MIGANVDEFSTDTGLTQNSNTKVPTQAAVKGYVDTNLAGLSSVLSVAIKAQSSSMSILIPFSISIVASMCVKTSTNFLGDSTSKLDSNPP